MLQLKLQIPERFLQLLPFQMLQVSLLLLQLLLLLLLLLFLLLQLLQLLQMIFLVLIHDRSLKPHYLKPL